MLNKYENLVSKLTNREQLINEITDLYLEEYEDLFEKILTTKEDEFLRELSLHVKSTIQDNYSQKAFENFEFCSLLKTIETSFYENNYKSDKKKILKPITDDSPEEQSSFTFRKHCKYQDDIPLHGCNHQNNFQTIYTSRYKNEVFAILCKECNLVYKAKYIKLYCSFCYISYYSCVEGGHYKKKQDINIQPATWEKYHCNLILNEQMKCITCRNPLYIDIKNNVLVCKKCDFKAEPYQILWKCLKCQQEFHSNAKIYNPYEYKTFSLAIKNALFQKISALPKILPCGHNPQSIRHKKECQGEIYIAYLNERKMIMCSKCRSLTKYDKYIFVCPTCNKKFRDNGTFDKLNEDNVTEMLEAQVSTATPTVVSGVLTEMPSIEDKKHLSSPDYKTNTCSTNNNTGTSNTNSYNIEGGSFKSKTLSSSSENPEKILISSKGLYSNLLLETTTGKTEEVKPPTPKPSSSLGDEGVVSSMLILNKIRQKNQSKNTVINDNSINMESFNLEDYDVISQIGQGKMSKILCVKETDSYSFYAMKKEIFPNETQKDKIVSQLKTQFVLSQETDFITKIYKIHVSNDEISVLQELAVNNWESEMVSNKKMKKIYTEEELISIIYQIADALDVMHSHNFAHFNINPNNVVIFKDKVYKLCDFGSIKQISQEHFSISFDELMENKFISPQINAIIQRCFAKKINLVNSKEINFAKNDIFALGLVIIYSMLNGSDCRIMNYDFVGIDLIQFRKATKAHRYIKTTIAKYLEYPNKINMDNKGVVAYSDKLEFLLMKMLSIDENERPTAAEIKEYIEKEYAS